MENEYYYKQQLKRVIDKIVLEISEDDVDNLGWVPDTLVKNMVEVCWILLMQSKQSNDFSIKQETESRQS